MCKRQCSKKTQGVPDDEERTLLGVFRSGANLMNISRLKGNSRSSAAVYNFIGHWPLFAFDYSSSFRFDIEKENREMKKKTPILNQVFILSLSLSCAFFSFFCSSPTHGVYTLLVVACLSLVSFSLNQQRVKATYRHLNCQVFSLILCRCLK
jgi:hypothetical protein